MARSGCLFFTVNLCDKVMEATLIMWSMIKKLLSWDFHSWQVQCSRNVANIWQKSKLADRNFQILYLKMYKVSGNLLSDSVWQHYCQTWFGNIAKSCYWCPRMLIGDFFLSEHFQENNLWCQKLQLESHQKAWSRWRLHVVFKPYWLVHIFSLLFRVLSCAACLSDAYMCR